MEFGTDKIDRICPGPNPDPAKPTRFTVPTGAVDTHAHVVGTDFVPERSYTPPPASASDYLRMLDGTGMSYGVLVQISVHGTDNRLMLDTLAENAERLRGVAVVAPDVADAELGILAEHGVVGLRLNTLAGGGFGFDQIGRYDSICREMGWHLQLLTNTWHLAEVHTRLSELSVPIVIDHMGDFDVSRGITAPDWRILLGLMADGAWAKLSGAYRLSDVPAFSDTVAFARSLIQTAPDRCVWGSDWPHVGFWGAMPNIADLLHLLAEWAPAPVVRDAILTTNAHRLYGFS
ncbi:amidohydrolase family protein [Nocardia sp. NPDC050630]|uniref:amidohydrolase family protein n=1 Tax=Nocardia sp. NPDC050630 TaxID=3364321 RepID=UPI0037B5DF78